MAPNCMYAQEGAGQTGSLEGKTKPSKAKDVVVQDMIAQLADNILAGDRRALARAITLIESNVLPANFSTYLSSHLELYATPSYTERIMSARVLCKDML